MLGAGGRSSARYVVCHSHRCNLSTTPSNVLQDRLRALLRDTAQPVAVVTSLKPSIPDGLSKSEPAALHGATLSSFSSLALIPVPLVAFSLRLPSRMGDTLKAFYRNSLSSADSDGATVRNPDSANHFVINMLSSSQADVAKLFSRPDLHHQPFSHENVRYELDLNGLPVLTGSIGALTCDVVGVYALCKNGLTVHTTPRQTEPGESELFIAEVLSVRTSADVGSLDDVMPLLYHRRRYGTVSLPINSGEDRG